VDTEDAKAFVEAFRAIQQATYATAKEKGWWDDQTPNHGAACIAYMHAELSDRLNRLRTKPDVGPDLRPHPGLKFPPEDDPVRKYVAQKIALVHSELSEALEGYLDKSDKLPEYTAMEEELADAIIRMMDMSEHFGWDLAGAVVAKMAYNQGRPFMHGGKKF